MESPFLSVSSAALVESNGPERGYYWDNSIRKPGQLIIKTTLSGHGCLVHDGRRYASQPGDTLLMITGDNSQYFYPHNATEPWVVTWISVRGCEAAIRSIMDTFGPRVQLEADGLAQELMRTLIELFQAKAFIDRYHTSELIYRFVMQMGRELTARTARTNRIRHARDYIADHHRRPVNIKEIAHHFGLSREHFVRSFRIEHGHPPGEYLNHCRLQTACRLLETTREPIEDIGHQCGFSSASVFSRAFSRKFGKPPLQWRTEERERHSH